MANLQNLILYSTNWILNSGRSCSRKGKGYGAGVSEKRVEERCGGVVGGEFETGSSVLEVLGFLFLEREAIIATGHRLGVNLVG